VVGRTAAVSVSDEWTATDKLDMSSDRVHHRSAIVPVHDVDQRPLDQHGADETL
jgi:hypothetical protein